MNNIFVGNLSFQATKEDLVKLFEPFGAVANAVIMERKKGKSRGYGFVDMPNEEEKNTAITALQGKEFMWRVLSVSPVIPKVKGEFSKKFKPAKKEWKPKSDYSSKSEASPESKSKYYSKLDGPPKPWQKSNSDSKPFRKDDHQGRKSTWSKSFSGSSNFYTGGDKSPATESKREGSAKPYKKFDAAASKSWNKPSGSPKAPFRKYSGPSKPFAKREDGPKPYSKPGVGFKMKHKVSGLPKAWPKKKEDRD